MVANTFKNKTFIPKKIISVLFLIVMVFMLTGCSVQNSIEKIVSSTVSEIDGADFSAFRSIINDDNEGKEITLDNGRTVTIKKSISHPSDEIIVTLKILKNEAQNENDHTITIKMKNIDGYANVISAKYEDGSDVENIKENK